METFIWRGLHKFLFAGFSNLKLIGPKTSQAEIDLANHNASDPARMFSV